MKDFFGQDLAVGDIVALTPHGYKHLVQGVIVGFTAQQVRVGYSRRLWNRQEDTTILRPPLDLIKRPQNSI